MTQAEMIGMVALALITLVGLITALTTPFNKLSEAINKLMLSVELLNHTVEGFKVIFNKQEDINDDLYKQLNNVKDDVKNLQHSCDLFQKTFTKERTTK